MVEVVNSGKSTLDLPMPSFVPDRYRPDLSAWSGHLAFANDLVSSIQPSLIVELGTHSGESYFTFCQSVRENGLSCLCYAIDNWQGESQTGFYGEEIFRDVHDYNASNYKSFSYLLRENFDDAVSQFADESIALLHIDGLHTYAAVTHDFRTWFPKLKAGGVVLLHDIAARHEDFGVWRFWDELCAEFPDTFEFHHSWGLGVMRKPGNRAPHSLLLEMLFDSPAPMRERIRRHYVLYAGYLDNTLRRPDGSRVTDSGVREKPELTIQVYPFGPSGYSEETSLIQHAKFGEWQNLSFILPPEATGPLRIDPTDCPSVVKIAKISLVDIETDAIIWTAADPTTLKTLSRSGAVTLESAEASLTLFCFDCDPQLIVSIPHRDSLKAIRLDISLRVHQSLESVANALEEITGKLVARTSEAIQAQREARMLQELVDSASDRCREEALSQAAVLKNVETELSNARSALASEQAIRAGMMQSRSWKITQPLRSFLESRRTQP